MRGTLISTTILLCALSIVVAKEKEVRVTAHAGEARTRYRLGKSPKPEFKSGGKVFKVDAKAPGIARVRELKPDEFDPLRRHARVEEFYHHVWHERWEEFHRRPHLHCGPFRSEFIYWTYDWPIHLRARWAWRHRHFFDDTLWAEWMQNREFAAQINIIQAQPAAPAAEYLPTEYATTSPVAVFNDEYLDAVYNPVPFLAVMNLQSLKPDAQTVWIGKAAADSLTARLSTIPGMFLSEPDQVQSALEARKKGQAIDVTEPSHAAEVGRALDVQQVVVGSYVADGEKVLFNLRMVDVETGRVINGLSTTVARDHLLDSLPELAGSIAGWLNKPGPDGSPADGTPPLLAGTPTLPGGALAAPVIPASLVTAASLPAKHTFGADEKFPGNLSFTAAEGPYQISDKLSAAEGVKKYTLTFGPGADLRGGNLHFGKGGGHVEISGTLEKPVIFREVEFDQYLGGSFVAHYAVFENCRFRKAGAYFSRSGRSSKWELDHCLIRGNNTFKDLSHVDYGFRFTDCTFSDVRLPEIGIPGKEQPVDVMKHLRLDWNEIDRCRFDGCTVSPTVFWCAQSSNYTRCKFIPGRAFESDTPTEVKAFVAETTGDAPDKLQGGPPPRAALHITYVPQPFTVFSFR